MSRENAQEAQKKTEQQNIKSKSEKNSLTLLSFLRLFVAN
jgi:hypothetical protein